MRIGFYGITLALHALLAACADGQILRPPRADPVSWASAGVGLVQAQTIEDYATGTSWNFGTMTQWRASFEHTLKNGGAVGLSGGLSKPTLAYEDPTGAPICSRCDARANVWQALALFRIGGGMGFHQVIELHAGVTGFSHFRTTEDDAELAPTGSVIDPTFAIGYGFSYGLSRGSQVVVVQDFGAILHRRENAPAGANTLRQYHLTRLGLRFALGG